MTDTEDSRPVYERLRVAAQRVRDANTELDEAEHEYRLAVEAVEAMEKELVK